MFRVLAASVLLGQCFLATAQEAATNNELPVFTPEQIRSDFEFMYEGLQSANFDLYAFTEPDEFDARYRAFSEGFDQPMTRFDTEVAFQQFVALARQAHTRVESDFSGFFAHLAKGGTVFPLDVAVHEGQLLVTGNASGVREIEAGDRITAIGDEPVADLLPRLVAHLSAESPEFAYVLLELYMPLVIWLESGRTDVSSVTIEHANGTKGAYDLSAATDEVQDSGDTAPPFSLEGRDARMLTETVAYLRPGPFSNTDPEENSLDATAYLVFIDAAFEGFIEKQAEHLILDLRDNPGGNSSFSDPVVAWFADRPFRFSSDFRVRVSPQTTAANQARLDSLPDGSNSESRLYAEFFASAKDGQTVLFPIPEVEPRSEPRFAGEVYALVNRYSFSNAVTTAALIQDYGFGAIMGEQTVDMATTYGAMERFTLPITGIVVTYPKALVVRPNGMETAHPLSPDIPLPSPRIRATTDVMLEAAVEHIHSENRASR
ncbi:MAG: S41 family peptidase [Woeseiaceae bacterium]|nr:S41 family peptidase [Woeseiaceae bacterium]